MQKALYTAQQVRDGERKAAADAGISMRQLMTAAGHAVFQQLTQHYSSGSAVAVCCGEGNNGGDGYIVARLAQQAGYRVKVFALKPGRVLDSLDSDDAQAARQAWREENNTESALTELQPEQFEVIVDALFGTGLSRPLDGDVGRWTDAVNQSGSAVIAVDIPSGIAADTGQVMGVAVAARWTVSMIALKRGMLTADAVDVCGQIVLADLQLAKGLAQHQTAEWSTADDDLCQQWLPPRKANCHKGDNGHVLIVAGNKGMAGAAILSSSAALRGGAGKVSVACHPDVVPIVASVHPEVMVHGVADKTELDELADAASVIVVGPGLGQNNWAQTLLDAVLEFDKPIVIDADGLNLVSQRSALPQGNDWIMTPHPGEASRLLGLSTKAVEHDRFAAVTTMRQRYSAEVLLKGAGSVISCQQGQFVIDRGSPAMASGGMGDCLSGLVAALRAQGMSSGRALVAASYWHAVAGEMAAEEGVRGTIATDLLLPIRQLVNGVSHSKLGENSSEYK